MSLLQLINLCWALPLTYLVIRNINIKAPSKPHHSHTQSRVRGKFSKSNQKVIFIGSDEWKAKVWEQALNR